MSNTTICIIVTFVLLLSACLTMKVTGIDDRYVIAGRGIIINNGYMTGGTPNWEHHVVDKGDHYEIHSRSTTEPLSATYRITVDMWGMYDDKLEFSRDWLYIRGYFDVD